MKAKILEGNVLETLKDLPACSVQCVVTSPPYYGLRDYGIDGQIGLEPTPEAYVEVLVTLFREIRRVLKDDGTVWLNLGDSYWGGKGSNANLDKGIENRIAEGRTIQRPQTRIQNMKVIPTNGKHESIKAKDLVGIPWMVAFALRNDGWYLRSEIIWNKPNPMPESMRDRPTKSHEQIFLFAKSSDYFYDYEAILEPAAYDGRKDTMMKGSKKYKDGSYLANGNANSLSVKGRERWRFKNLQEDGQQPNTIHERRAAGLKDEVYAVRNKRDVWTISTKPYSGAHFATYPTELIEPCILAGSRVGDTVLDPFNGSGTTGEVAIKHHRFYIGCEINPEYVKLAKKRLSKVQPVLMPEIRTTLPAPDGGDSAPSKTLSTPDMFSAIEHEPTPAPRR